MAATVLGGAIVGFAAAMMALDRAGSRIFGAVVSGVVAGARGWRDGADGSRPVSDHSSPWGLRSTVVPVDRGQVPDRTDGARREAVERADADGPGELTEDGVEPIETLDRVRPRVR